MIKIGIDPSINCTGVCIWDTVLDVQKYYMIPSKTTKKMERFKHNFVYMLPYNKVDSKGMEYSQRESIKFDNIYNICSKIGWILDCFNPDEVYMEGVSYGSTGSAALVDLSFLNASIRMELKRRGINFTIVSPTSLKKFACANGQAEKDIMIDAWMRMDRNVVDIKDIKVDDLADSYFLAHYNVAT